jgi:hypothetical protein
MVILDIFDLHIIRVSRIHIEGKSNMDAFQERRTAAQSGIALTACAAKLTPIQYLRSRARIVGIIGRKVAEAAGDWREI